MEPIKASTNTTSTQFSHTNWARNEYGLYSAYLITGYTTNSKGSENIAARISPSMEKPRLTRKFSLIARYTHIKRLSSITDLSKIHMDVDSTVGLICNLTWI